MEKDKYTIPDGTRIGHVHLKVSDIDRSLEFYENILGFEVTSRMGDNAVFLSAGGYHHHIALNTWFSKNGPKPQRNTTGLFHLAILYPDRKSLSEIFNRLIDSNYQIDGASDHGVSEAIYLRDPDGNGVELYRDRDPKDWPKKESGELNMYTKQLDIEDLLSVYKNK